MILSHEEATLCLSSVARIQIGTRAKSAETDPRATEAKIDEAEDDSAVLEAERFAKVEEMARFSTTRKIWPTALERLRMVVV